MALMMIRREALMTEVYFCLIRLGHLEIIENRQSRRMSDGSSSQMPYQTHGERQVSAIIEVNTAHPRSSNRTLRRVSLLAPQVHRSR
jgi:hypothetical protein